MMPWDGLFPFGHSGCRKVVVAVVTEGAFPSL
jgi:hypothetical protein